MTAPYRVVLINRSATGAETTCTLEVGPRSSVLGAALAAGERLPYACRNGECGSCVAKLVGGTVAHPQGTVLTEAQRARGYILLCLVTPTSDCVIEVGLATQRSMYDPPAGT